MLVEAAGVLLEDDHWLQVCGASAVVLLVDAADVLLEVLLEVISLTEELLLVAVEEPVHALQV